MVRSLKHTIVWTDPALFDLDTIADYIALDKPAAAKRLIQRVVAAVERLQTFPAFGRSLPEIPDLPYREVIVPPCRVVYRVGNATVTVVMVLRGEQCFDLDLLRARLF